MSKRLIDCATDVPRSSKRARLTDDHCHLLDAVADVRAVISGFLPLADRIRLAWTCTTLKLEGAKHLELGAYLGIPCSMSGYQQKAMADWLADTLANCIITPELGDVRSLLDVQWHGGEFWNHYVSFTLRGRTSQTQLIFFCSYGEWYVCYGIYADVMASKSFDALIDLPVDWDASRSFVEGFKYLYLPRTDVLPLETMYYGRF